MADKQAKMLAMLKKRKQELAAPSASPIPPFRPAAPSAAPTAGASSAAGREKRSAPTDAAMDKKPRASAQATTASAAPATGSTAAKSSASARLPSLKDLSGRSRVPTGASSTAPTSTFSASSVAKASISAATKPAVPNTSIIASSRKSAMQAAAAASGAGGKTMEQQMEEKLQGAQFRWLNEKLYTTTSSEAVALMESDPSLFEAYHAGFRHQVTKWPVNPVDIFTAYVRAHPKFVVGDFGCGDAQIARSVPNTVHSFDLVAVNDHVTACDIRKTPLPDETLDLAIFSLALMGTNLGEFIQEAHRTLKRGALLKIAEVRSRFDEQQNGIPRFIAAVEECGFKHKATDAKNTHFVLLDFIKTRTDAPQGGKPKAFAAGSVLKPCIYKRR